MEAFREDRSPDGGLYVPEEIPKLSWDALCALGRLTENAAAGKLLAMYLGDRITPWDLDFSVGRRWIRQKDLDRKNVLIQCWHNPEGALDYLLRFLSERLGQPSGFWARTVLQIAAAGTVLARMAVQGELTPEEPAEFAAVSGDFSGVLAGLYLKGMGFPVGKLICCCNENNSVWELVHLGQLRTDGVCLKTQTPRADILLPMGLEHLLCCLGGEKAALEYARCAYMGLTYVPEEALAARLQRLIFVGVVSRERLSLTLNGVLKNYGCILSPYTAIAYASAQDYRAKSGENRLCLLLSDRNPSLDSQYLAALLGLSQAAVKEYLNSGR